MTTPDHEWTFYFSNLEKKGEVACQALEKNPTIGSIMGSSSISAGENEIPLILLKVGDKRVNVRRDSELGKKIQAANPDYFP